MRARPQAADRAGFVSRSSRIAGPAQWLWLVLIGSLLAACVATALPSPGLDVVATLRVTEATVEFESGAGDPATRERLSGVLRERFLAQFRDEPSGSRATRLHITVRRFDPQGGGLLADVGFIDIRSGDIVAVHPDLSSQGGQGTTTGGARSADPAAEAASQAAQRLKIWLMPPR